MRLVRLCVSFVLVSVLVCVLGSFGFSLVEVGQRTMVSLAVFVCCFSLLMVVYIRCSGCGFFLSRLIGNGLFVRLFACVGGDVSEKKSKYVSKEQLET